jgi:hypothetical protein
MKRNMAIMIYTLAFGTIVVAQDGNTTLGTGAGASITSGDNNTLLGENAGAAVDFGSNNVFIGKDAGLNMDNESGNVFIGWLAGSVGNIGIDNVFVGEEAGSLNNGSSNTFIGSSAGKNNNLGRDNTFIGQGAGMENTEGSDNTFVGEDAGNTNTTGSENAAFGCNALLLNTTGYDNVVLGYDAGYQINSHDNTCVGHQAGTDLGNGFYNTFIGSNAGSNTEYGDFNTFVGVYAGGDNNRNNGTDNANRNTYMGVAAGTSSREGQDNVAIGAFADFSSWVGIDESTVISTLDQDWPSTVSSGINNSSRTVMIGSYARAGANDATSIGYLAETMPGADRSLTIGSGSNSTHADAITIGYNATSHAANTAVIGNDTTVAWHPGADAVTSLGDATYRFTNVNAQTYNAIAGTGAAAEISLWADNGMADDDKWQISAADGGDFTISSFDGTNYVDRMSVANNGNVTIPGEISMNSDARLKQNIRSITNALTLIGRLDGKTYEWKTGLGRDDRRHYGLIAQEIEAVIPEMVTKSDDGTKSVNYQAAVPVLINAVKELQTRDAEKMAELDSLRQEMATMRQILAKASIDQTNNDEVTIVAKMASSK